MKLRDHPLMTYKGFRSWPPAWLWRGGYETTYPEGEVGILENVMPSTLSPPRPICRRTLTQFLSRDLPTAS
jgi:hypothetical protein